MQTATVFSLANTLVLPMWLVLIVAPKWRPTQFLIKFKIVPLILALIYAVYIGIALLQTGIMDFGILQSVMQLFTQKNAVLAGWVHYLAFDLLVGMYLLQQNKKIGLHQLVMAPCLFLTFMFGPVGFLLFIIFKNIKKRAV